MFRSIIRLAEHEIAPNMKLQKWRFHIACLSVQITEKRAKNISTIGDCHE